MAHGFSRTALSNGIRVISERVPSVRSVSIGVWINVGSRNEAPQVNGISHFIEHMLFKRTTTRSAFQIAQALEALGGSINAFTAREHTCYYARILNRHLPQAMDVLGDILNNSVLAPHDLKKEKSVIIEEIKDIADTPSEYVHDLLGMQVWKHHSLGRPIMGNAKNIMALARSTVQRYIAEHYCGPNTVVAAAGDVSHDLLVSLTRKCFASWSPATISIPDQAPQQGGFSIRAYRSRTKQTQVCLGFPSIAFADEHRYPLLAANTYLSGGMSSRLFRTVRE